jgi:putative membrane protein
MTDWWVVSSMGVWLLLLWIVFIIIAVLIYNDVQERKMNGLLWFVLVVLPYIGIMFLITYLVIRKEKQNFQSSQKDILDVFYERYTRGKISSGAYQKMKLEQKGMEGGSE